MKKSVLLTLFGLFGIVVNLSSQSSTINPTDACINCTTNTEASAVLDVRGTDKGILIPRMTAAQRDAITNPATGLLVFVTNNNQFYYFNGSLWVQSIGVQGPAGPAGADGDTFWESPNNGHDIEANNGGDVTIHNRLELGTSFNNTFIGIAAGGATTPDPNDVFGQENTMIGDFSGGNNMTGYRNTFVGVRSGEDLDRGEENVFVGIEAGSIAFNAAYSTCIGAYANLSDPGLDNAMALGYSTIVNDHNKVRIGNNDVTVIEGAVNFSSTSDKRFKKSIREESTKAHHDFILNLSPVSYQFKKANKNNTARYSGFLAQDVEKAAKEVGYGEFSGIVKPEINGGKYALRYAEFVVPLVGAVQEQQALIEKQQAQINERDDRISQLEEDVAELKTMLEKVIEGKTTQNIQSTTIESTRLGQNLPNPFNSSTQIPYTIPNTAQKANILIHGINGQLIKTVAINSFGEGTLELQTTGLSKGQYTYSLEVDGRLVETKQMQLVR